MTTAHDTGRVSLSKDAPALYRAHVALDRAVRESALDRRTLELVKVRASQVNGCAYCIDMHTRDALAAGETQRRLFALAAWPESPLFDDRERAALALADAVTLIADDAVPDAVYAAAAERFSTEELTALIFAIAVINSWNRLAIATGAVFEAPEDR
jgi:AhpD family alkylhydroperoxidase